MKKKSTTQKENETQMENFIEIRAGEMFVESLEDAHKLWTRNEKKKVSNEKDAIF